MYTVFIPKVLNIAKKLTGHEIELFEKITKPRTSARNTRSASLFKFQTEMQLQQELRNLIINVKNYPQLKSHATRLEAIKTYRYVEDDIAAARRFYNSALTQLRNVLQIFSCSLFAHLAKDVIPFAYSDIDKGSCGAINPDRYL